MLIGNEIGALVKSAGFDPFIGFVHGLRYGRQSLPLDLVEEFRHPVVDGLVITVINNGSIKKEDFYKENNGGYFLEKKAFKRFLGYFEEGMEKLFIYREQDSQTSYHRLFQIQAEKIQKAVLNREEYQPFLVR